MRKRSRLNSMAAMDQASADVEGIDFSYGQKEKLTTRLHNLLKDSYTDGFSVPKELIQNADDAGATEVRFLLDERENKDARSNLISAELDSLQGPAIWAFNDATFTDKDFENIIKLGRGTKQEDASKIGRFGLGFNAVYNLTDVPSFLSRHVLAILDPHEKYLPMVPGLKIDFTHSVNRLLLSRMPSQFKPFQSVFDCRLDENEDVFYNGTLFRFPLRTEKQAEESEIKAESYSQAKRQEFLKMLLDRAGSLLMFTQNVRKIQVFHLPANCSDPRQARCLLTVTRSCLGTDLLSGPSPLQGSILQYCTANWQTHQDIKIFERVSIVVDVTDDAKAVCNVDKVHIETHWKLAWATGTDESAKAVQRHNMVGFVPLATVAALLSENTIQPLSKSPFGFYTSGHLFCFMPLPKEMVDVSFPVHVNGTFDLTSSRRSLQVQTEDDMSSGGLDWNSALFGDAVCRAYLLLLERVADEASGDQNYRRYFELWPDSGKDSLDKNFYRRLVYDENKVFPVPGQDTCVSFSDAWLLDPDFRESECGQLAWDATNHFWDTDGGLVDVSAHVCRLIQRNGQADAFKARVITKREFYERFFYPHISGDYWRQACEGRDKLVHHALLEDDKNILSLVRTLASIPCEGTGDLRRPVDLIHPSKQASRLYRSCDGHFPQGAEKRQHDDKVNFCFHSCLLRLQQLGMTVDDLPMEMVLERARSISTLLDEDHDAALQRVHHLIDYLSSVKGHKFRFDSYDPEERKALSRISWFPVLRKPDDWSFRWAGSEGSPLAAPDELFADSLKDLVACGAKLLDSKAVGGSASYVSLQKKAVLQSLGLKTAADYKCTRTFDIVTHQLLTVRDYKKENPTSNKDLVDQVCHVTYAFLNKCISEHGSQTAYGRLCNEDVIWMNNRFLSASRVAFSCVNNCQPYLFQLEESLQRYKALFRAIGVKEAFSKEDALSVLKEIYDAYRGRQLDDDWLGLVSRVAELLRETIKFVKDDGLGEREDVYLPDREKYMTQTNHLCLDDCPWLQESASMRFVHDFIAPETAQALGVKTKRGKDFDELMRPIPFGQHEKLTTRIQRLLEGYTFDSSLFKELLQNADDAGATEIRFILDMRSLNTERVPEGWSEHLQGPALCVYNNKSFTSKDMKGIQNLGEGSKGEDMLKTGQYGVGFNAVYHITDVPSFWTLENDTREVICVFDPNCKYVRNAALLQPGVKLEDVDRVRTAYPDMFASYLAQTIDMTKPGTMFRFPLRTQAMADVSALKQPAVTGEKIEKLLQDFTKEAKSCLLFLNNLQKIGIYQISAENGDLKLEYEAEKHIETASSGQLAEFKAKVVEASKITEDASKGLQDIAECEAVVQMILTDSTAEENWLTVNRVGFADSGSLSARLLREWKQKNFRLLPRGGVAFRLSEKRKEHKVSRKEVHRAFCVLPLPVQTGLPMHVNGQFCLDHETRRNLWENQNDYKTEWNTTIARQVIVPAFVTAIQQVKHAWFTAVTDPAEAEDSVEKLNAYHELFPKLENAPSEFWTTLMKEIYRRLASEEFPAFPVTSVDGPGIHWAPAVKQNGYPGYFNSLPNNFSKSPASSPVVLTQGFVSQASSTTSNTWRSEEKTEELVVLLKKLNMKVLHTPFRVYEAFKKSGVKELQEVTPASVIQFLKSASSTSNDGCNIRDLPQPVENTALEKASNVELIVSYIENEPAFRAQLDALPLCLRQSGNLYPFEAGQDDKTPIASRFCSLLPGSADLFLHENIIQYLEPLFEETQAWLQPLNIPTLARLLPDTLSESEYRTGGPTAFSQVNHPWVQQLWLFLQNQLDAHNDFDVTVTRQKIEHELLCLSHWSLMPVRKNSGSPKQFLLYPVKDMHQVVYLSRAVDQTNPVIWQILQKLPLPFLETLHLPESSVATKIVASISHPMALLRALTFCIDNLGSVMEHGLDILQYFSNSFPVLHEACSDETELRTMLRSLPFFTTADGSLVSVSDSVITLCLPTDLPKDGLLVWAKTQGIMLLQKSCVPENVCKFLGLGLPSEAQFYHSHLLPAFHALPSEAILGHMSRIRTYLNTFDEVNRESLTRQLKVTAFIEVDGRRHMARQFFSPHEPVFQKMLTQQSFPPKPFCDQKWHHFMKEAGYVHEVTADIFLQFAKHLEGQPEITDDVCERSRILVHHLFQRNDLERTNLTRRVQNICFVCPSTWQSTPEGELLTKVVQPFSKNRLVSFAESSRERHLHLVWSSSCIIHPSVDPWCHRFFLSRDQENACLDQLNFREYASKEKVLQHTQNVCLALHGSDGPEIFRSLEANSKDLLLSVMENLYAFLEREASNRDTRLLNDLPIICDIGKKQMLYPKQVVLDLRDDEAIAGHVQKAPPEFGKFFEFFKRLGVAEYVTADHYADVLYHIGTAAAGSSLHAQELQVVRVAVKGLFACLKSGRKGQGKLTTQVLYLPSENMQLLTSTKLTFIDYPSLKTRFDKLPVDLHFFLNFDRLGLTVMLPLDEVKRLPEMYQMVRLSKIVSEVIPDDVKCRATEGACSRALVDRLEHVDFFQAVGRLAYNSLHRGSDDNVTTEDNLTLFTEETVELIKLCLSRISIFEAEGLTTVLLFRNTKVEGSDKKKKSYVEKKKEDVRTCTVYVDPLACGIGEPREHPTVLRSLEIAVTFVLNMELDRSLLQSALRNPTEALEHMDEEGIARCDFTGVFAQSIFPPPGTFVPKTHHCYLDNSFVEFEHGEYVGFEAYDPELEIAQGTEKTATEEDAVYIYAKIIKEVSQGGEEVSLLLRKYRINLGQERGEAVVSVTKLYKFVRQTSTAVAEYDEETAASMPAPSFDEQAVLKEIRATLLNAWRLPDEADRMRVVKRLLLKWHPDKNKSNEKFCTRVFQTIQYYVELLREGKTLPENEDEVDGPCANNTAYSPFFEHMFSRGRAYNTYYESGFDSGGFGYRSRRFEDTNGSRSAPNPQPTEGRRWFRQAEADFEAARAARGSCDRGHNWVCFKCQQACEKALKAVLYQRDAENHLLRAHDLGPLAGLVNDPGLVQLARSLVERLGNHMRMRYPDVMAYPNIPADVYTSNDADFACALTFEVLKSVRYLME